MRRFELYSAVGDGLTILLETTNDVASVVKCGDYYHDKIEHVIEGYLEGIKEYIDVEVKEYELDIEDESEFDREKVKGNQ